MQSERLTIVQLLSPGVSVRAIYQIKGKDLLFREVIQWALVEAGHKQRQDDEHNERSVVGIVINPRTRLLEFVSALTQKDFTPLVGGTLKASDFEFLGYTSEDEQNEFYLTETAIERDSLVEELPTEAPE